MFRAAAPAGLCLLTACNAIFGLDPVTGDGAGVIDATSDAIDAPNPDDLDGDGVPAGLDNCPAIANPRQADDDTDGVGDVCDLCPQIADAGLATNVDGDGIGDTCGDPDTGSAQCTVWFDGFGDDRTMASYTTAGMGHGAWAMGGGAMHQTQLAAPDAFLHLQAPAFAAPLAIAPITIDDRIVGLPLADSWQVGLWTSVAMPGALTPDGVLGMLFEQGGGNSFAHAVIRRHVDGVTDVVGSSNTFRTMAHGVPFEVRLDSRATNNVASVFFDGGGTRIQVPMEVTAAPGTIGLRTRNMQASFGYLLVLANAPAGECPPRVEP